MNTTPDVAALIAEARARVEEVKHWNEDCGWDVPAIDVVTLLDTLEALSQSSASVSDDARDAAEFIELELRTGFLNPNVIAPGSKADTALRTLIAAAARTELGMADDEPNAATGHDTRAEYDRLMSPAAPVFAEQIAIRAEAEPVPVSSREQEVLLSAYARALLDNDGWPTAETMDEIKKTRAALVGTFEPVSVPTTPFLAAGVTREQIAEVLRFELAEDKKGFGSCDFGLTAANAILALVPPAQPSEVTDAMVKAFTEAWEAKAVEIGLNITPKGTKVRAGLEAVANLLTQPTTTEGGTNADH